MNSARTNVLALIAALSAISGSSVAQNQAREEWVARYDGLAGDRDRAHALVVDHVGNVYVTGFSEGSDMTFDYATVKYSADGEELWVARGGATSANALALGSEGDVHVTGGGNYTTVKYSGAGEELWVARYDGGDPTLGDDANAIVVDNDGSVYVTGHASYDNDEGEGDYATVKYTGAGEELWVARYDGPAGWADDGRAIAVDNEGNIYVTGDSEGAGGVDYATVKYSSEGEELWVARYEGGYATSLAIDRVGNVYVTGRSFGSDWAFDYATVKYSSEGEELWVARYDGPAGDSDSASAIALDSEGNVYVTGSSQSSDGAFSYATVKYSADGEELWAVRYDGPGSDHDIAMALALDAAGNVYVAGYSEGSGTGWDYVTVKYSQGFGPEIIPADCNADGALDLGDAICLLGYLFGDMPAVLPCGDGTVTDAANVALIDSNGDDGIDLGDPIYVLSYLFADGPPPVLGTECVVIVGCPDVCGAIPAR